VNGYPDSIVARDWRVVYRKLCNSLYTVAPTTVSFLMSVFFSFYLSFALVLATRAESESLAGIVWAVLFLVLAAVATRLALPKNRFSKFHKPDTQEPFFRRIVVLNIDGCRKDALDRLDLPGQAFLKTNGTTHEFGLRTVYRALRQHIHRHVSQISWRERQQPGAIHTLRRLA